MDGVMHLPGSVRRRHLIGGLVISASALAAGLYGFDLATESYRVRAVKASMTPATTPPGIANDPLYIRFADRRVDLSHEPLYIRFADRRVDLSHEPLYIRFKDRR